MIVLDFDNLKVNELVGCIRYDTAKNVYPIHNMGRRRSGIIYNAVGTELYRFSDRTFLVNPGTVLIIPKGSEYHVELDGESNVCYVFECELEFSGEARPAVVKPGSFGRFERHFIDAERIWRTKKTAYKAECMSLLYRVIALLSQTSENIIHPANYEKIRASVEYLHEHYCEQSFRIESLHRMARMDEKYFRELFIRKFGIPPKTYVTELKIQRAKELLGSDKQNITEIASLLGYTDVYHFSKAFKQRTGVPPSRWTD